MLPNAPCNGRVPEDEEDIKDIEEHNPFAKKYYEVWDVRCKKCGELDTYIQHTNFWAKSYRRGFQKTLNDMKSSNPEFNKMLDEFKRTFCPRCHHQITMDYEFCPNCGRDFRIKK